MPNERIELISQSPVTARVMQEGRQVGLVQQEMDRWTYTHWTHQNLDVGAVDLEFRADPGQVDQVPAYVRFRLQRMCESGQIKV